MLHPRQLRYVATALVACVIGGVGFFGTAQGEDPRYVFANIRVAPAMDPRTGEPDGSHAVLTYDYAWSGNVYPGTRSCLWTIFDTEGQPVGSRRDLISAHAKSAQGLESLVDVAGDPHRAEVECESRRYDDPQGRFSVSESRPVRHPAGGWAVSLDATWQGEGVPSAQRCLVDLRDSQGRVVRQSVEFAGSSVVLEDALVQLRLDPSTDKREFVSATTSCSPGPP